MFMVAQVFNKYCMYSEYIAVFTVFLHLTLLSQFKPIHTLMGLLSYHLLLESPKFPFLSDSDILNSFSCLVSPFHLRLGNVHIASYRY